MARSFCCLVVLLLAAPAAFQQQPSGLTVAVLADQHLDSTATNSTTLQPPTNVTALSSTTLKPTANATTENPTTVKPSTNGTTLRPTTDPTTLPPTTLKPTTNGTTLRPTTLKPTTLEPSTVPTTTPPPTTPTTLIPVTNGTSPVPTTEATTVPSTVSPTTPGSPSSSTVKPSPSSTSSTSAPYTTRAPKPPPFPQNVGTWSFPNTSSPCIMLKAALQLHINATNSSSELVVNVPSGKFNQINVSGDCGSLSQVMRIHWLSPSNITVGAIGNNTIVFNFTKQPHEQYGLDSIGFYFNGEEMGNIKGPLFKTKLDHSFLCSSNQRIVNKLGTFSVLLQDLQLEAFRQNRSNSGLDGEPKFGRPEECEADHPHHTSTVGIVLGSLVIGITLAVIGAFVVYVLVKNYRQGGFRYNVLENDSTM